MNGNILLVDDEASLRRTVALGLMQHGFETIPCENGFAALRKLDIFMKNKIPPDVAVVDIKLPDIDGVKLVKIIRFKYPGIPVIIITAYGELVSSEEITSLNVNAFLEKPFSVDDLSSECEQILHERKQIERKETSTPVNVSAYILLSLKEDADMLSLYRELYYMDNIIYCDATRGEYDIMLLVQARDYEELKEIYKKRIISLEGIEKAEYLEIKMPLMDESMKRIIKDAESALSAGETGFLRQRDFKKHVCSYVLIEMEKEKMEDLYPALRLNENVVYCDCLSGRYDLILFVHGTDFTRIERIINEKIRTMDGILRIKECPVVNLFDM
ncbi:MAG: Lrp/AsnC ligand binding domain-containing protein [Spirochaetales bacterium]|nr:Lrp/AsnC ligand binding domain-containing protein [Spirochaetales bacterium]